MHPEVAGIACSECQKFIFDIKTGELLTYETPDGVLPVPRVDEPPCRVCPKGGPQNEHLLTLWTENRRAMDFYHRMKAVPQAMPRALAVCKLMQSNFRLIDQVIESAKLERKNLLYDKAMSEQEQDEDRDE